MSELPRPDYARNMRLIGHSDQRGRPDGVQVMVHRGFAYVGHMFSKGWSVIDVCDPKRPRAVNYVPAPPGIWNIHLQTHDDLLLVVHAKDMFAAAEFADERSYYRGQLGQIVGTAQGRGAARDWRRVFDIADPFRPLEVGALVPAAPTRLMDHRPNRARVIQSADVYVDAAGLITAPTIMWGSASWNSAAERNFRPCQSARRQDDD